jgi:hypothetical protein
MSTAWGRAYPLPVSVGQLRDWLEPSTVQPRDEHMRGAATWAVALWLCCRPRCTRFYVEGERDRR